MNDQPAASRAEIPPARGLMRLAAFFALLGLLVVLLDFLINSGFRKITTSDFGVTNQIISGKVNADIVISGSSRALVHYDPRIIAELTGHSAYNIGRNGSQTDLQLAVLKAYLKHNTKPRLLIHNLDLFSFVMSKEIYDPAQYIPYLHDDAIYDGVRRVYPDAWKWRYLPLYAYMVEDLRLTWLQGIKAHVGWRPVEDHYLGFVPRYVPWAEDFEKFRRANPNGIDTSMEAKGIEDIREIAAICRREGIPLVFVYAPEYIEMQTLERNRAEVFEKFQAICREFNVQLWDYSDTLLSRARENFYNSQHLNAQGAALFSAKVGSQIAESAMMKSKP